jgi:hypothetical protein
MEQDSKKIVGELYKLGFGQDDLEDENIFDFVPLEDVFSEERVKVWIDQGYAKQINGYDTVGYDVVMSFLTESGIRLVLTLAF